MCFQKDSDLCSALVMFFWWLGAGDVPWYQTWLAKGDAFDHGLSLPSGFISIRENCA